MINCRDIGRWCQNERPNDLVMRCGAGRVACSLKVHYGIPPESWWSACPCGESWSHYFRREVWLVLEWSENSWVCLWGCRTVAPRVKGRQSVELAQVQELYQVQGIFSTLHIVTNIDPRVWYSCQPRIPNLVASDWVSISYWWNEWYGNSEGCYLQWACIEDVGR